MLVLPNGLLARFDEPHRGDLVAVAECLVAGLGEQYEIERRSFSKDDFDDGLTFGWGLRQRSFNRSADVISGRPGVNVRSGGVRQSMSVGEVTVRCYRFGSEPPADIHMERLDTKSMLKQFMVLDNAERAQLQLDIRGAVNPAPATADSYASNELVIAHYGSASKGLQAIFLGAPLSEMADGSYWAWVVQLRGPRDDEFDDDARGARGADGPTPYDRGEEPELPLAPRRRDERREQ